MSQPEQQKHPYIAYLESLINNVDRGALAALRRGLGQPIGTATEMYRYVVPWLPVNASQTVENAYYLIGSLFAYHPDSVSSGNLGFHLAQTRSEGGEDALERRFTVLLAAHSDDLPNYLRQAVSYLKSHDIPINWNQLFFDILAWGAPEHRVQKAWARAFWGFSQVNQPGV